jgi:hypothetical protein
VVLGSGSAQKKKKKKKKITFFDWFSMGSGSNPGGVDRDVMMVLLVCGLMGDMPAYTTLVNSFAAVCWVPGVNVLRRRCDI